jgi:hypothetical protein
MLMKNKWIPEPDEFFVGYIPDAPQQTSFILRRIIICLGVVVVIIGMTIAVSQREFSTANFEYGKFITVEGYLFNNPLPHLRIERVKDSTGLPSYQTVLLVGEGKAGANETIKEYETHLGKMEGHLIKLQGQLIHGHHKVVLQLSSERLPERVDEEQALEPVLLKEINDANISGEIVDPKCYFGVMKPGEGKPHRSCAIRCIAGGIPPVFHVNGLPEYYLLLDENHQPVNQRVLDIVGDNITLQGKAYQFDDWKIFLLNESFLKEQAKAGKLRLNLMAMREGITSCENK